MNRFRSQSAFTEISAQIKNVQELVAKPQGPGDSTTSSPPQLDQVLTRSSLITIGQPPLEISDSTSGGALVVSRQQNYIRRMCFCRTQRSNKKAVWQIGPSALFSRTTRSSKHFPDCPYHTRWENTQRYGVEVVLPTSDGRRFVQAFLNWNAGGILPSGPGSSLRQQPRIPSYRIHQWAQTCENGSFQNP